MSSAETSRRWSNWTANGLSNSPRIILLAAIVTAWITTLAWPPPLADYQPRVDTAAVHNPDYIVRISLPTSQPVEAQELIQLVREHASLARLDLNLPDLKAGEFDNAFSDILAPLPSAKSAPIPDLEPGEVLNLDYDLATLEPAPETFNASDKSMTVRKPLFVDGVNSGSATIRIEEGAQILIATSAIANALGERVDDLPTRISGALAQGNGFIPFYELRGVGIGVEYDPVSDRISLSMPS